MIIQIGTRQTPVIAMGRDKDEYLFSGGGRYLLAQHDGLISELRGEIISFHADAVQELTQQQALSWCSERKLPFDYSARAVI